MATVNSFSHKQYFDYDCSDRDSWKGSQPSYVEMIDPNSEAEYHHPRRWDSHQAFTESPVEYYRNDFAPKSLPMIHDARYESFDMSYPKELWAEGPRSATDFPAGLYGDELGDEHMLPDNPGWKSSSIVDTARRISKRKPIGIGMKDRSIGMSCQMVRGRVYTTAQRRIVGDGVDFHEGIICWITVDGFIR
ncbi:Protein of unknown function [Pyronema omphalodes CBS 100304]|uniref:Uncharacterized protein n=1 Tax=Pyronema omphalodes (strain CBS 100304) TaxID=1076935 RepID=U4LMG0_PYROM|nr:Protein of unknown function [Pyronema omphalodes CBS 100304]